MQDNVLDQYVHRLQNIQSFNVYAVNSDGKVEPWYEVTGTIVHDLILKQDQLAVQVETIGGQIQFWGRLVAQCKRVWEIEERDFRIWRSKEELRLSKPPDDPEEAKAWKKPSQANIDAQIRVTQSYRKWYGRTERAEEAYNAANAVLDGFRAKRDMLKAYVYRHAEDGSARLSV